MWSCSRAALNKHTQWFTSFSWELGKCLIFSQKWSAFKRNLIFWKLKSLFFTVGELLLRDAMQSVLTKWTEESYIWVIALNVNFHLRKAYCIARYSIKVMAINKQSKIVKNKNIVNRIWSNLTKGINNATSQGNEAIKHSHKSSSVCLACLSCSICYAFGPKWIVM